MTNRDPQFDAYVMQIHKVLDRLDYYRLLGVDASSDIEVVKAAYRQIAARFHPDRNRDASADVQKAIYDIFKRLNEGYRVLCDPKRRKYYNQRLTEGHTRLDVEVRTTMIDRAPEDTIQNRDARNFYLQAKQAFEKGDKLHAELHIKVAAMREPENEAIQELAAQVFAAKKKS